MPQDDVFKSIPVYRNRTEHHAEPCSVLGSSGLDHDGEEMFDSGCSRRDAVVRNFHGLLDGFFGVRDWHYGNPNDEALDAHPLYGRGLTPYDFHRTLIVAHGERAWIATFHDGE
jgi:hypothetical protein